MRTKHIVLCIQIFSGSSWVRLNYVQATRESHEFLFLPMELLEASPNQAGFRGSGSKMSDANQVSGCQRMVDFQVST